MQFFSNIYLPSLYLVLHESSKSFTYNEQSPPEVIYSSRRGLFRASEKWSHEPKISNMQYSREDVSIGFFGHIVNQDVLGAGKEKRWEKTGAIHEVERTL